MGGGGGGGVIRRRRVPRTTDLRSLSHKTNSIVSHRGCEKGRGRDGTRELESVRYRRVWDSGNGHNIRDSLYRKREKKEILRTRYGRGKLGGMESRGSSQVPKARVSSLEAFPYVADTVYGPRDLPRRNTTGYSKDTCVYGHGCPVHP